MITWFWCSNLLKMLRMWSGRERESELNSVHIPALTKKSPFPLWGKLQIIAANLDPSCFYLKVCPLLGNCCPFSCRNFWTFRPARWFCFELLARGGGEDEGKKVGAKISRKKRQDSESNPKAEGRKKCQHWSGLGLCKLPFGFEHRVTSLPQHVKCRLGLSVRIVSDWSWFLDDGSTVSTVLLLPGLSPSVSLSIWW